MTRHGQNLSELQRTVRSMHPGGLRLTDRAARLASITQGMMLLDVGCGAGVSLEFLSRKFGIIPLGIDISADMISIASQMLPGSMLTTGNAGQIPYESDSIDAVICECVLSLVENPMPVIREMRRVLRPDGTLIVSDICGENDFYEIQTMFTDAGFDVTNLEEHKAALITYAAEAHLEGAIPSCFAATVETARTIYGNSTYYLLICRKE